MRPKAVSTLARDKRQVYVLVPTLLLAFAISMAITLMALSAHSSMANASAYRPYSVASPNGLVINEVSDSQNVALEYFELYNTAPITIDLSTYQIYNRDGSSPLSRLKDPLISPGGFRVIGPAQLGLPTIAGSGLAAIDFLGLKNIAPTDQIVDVVNWGAPPNPNWPNYDLFSGHFFQSNYPILIADNPKDIQRWPDGMDADLGVDWRQIERSPGVPSCGDPYEDDDTLSTAYWQSAGTTNLHRICPASDNDFILFNASPAFNYMLQADAIGSQVDTMLRLYDPSGNLIAESDPALSRDSQISFIPPYPGSYRVQVTDHYGQGGIGHDYLYSFTISQSPAATATPIPPMCMVGFQDVPLGSTFFSFVRCLACRGIVSGYSCGNPEPCVPPGNPAYFRPGQNVTRAQLAKIVANAAGFSDPASSQTFQDVPPGSTFYDFVERMATRNIMTGYACGGVGEPCLPPGNLPYFRPSATATRGQIAKIVALVRNYLDPPGNQIYEDVAPGSTFYTFIQQLTLQNVMTGYACGNPEPCVPPLDRPYFRPGQSATRGQVAKVVSMAFFSACAPVPTPVPTFSPPD